jgi:hypothetical protein
MVESDWRLDLRGYWFGKKVDLRGWLGKTVVAFEASSFQKNCI